MVVIKENRKGVDFIIKCIKEIEQLENICILIVGCGTEYDKLKNAIELYKLKNTKLYKYMPKAEYDCLLQACDVGLIFWDYRFTIPNFPSRILAYMDAQKPVLAAVDSNTDIGRIIIVEGQFGWTCSSENVEEFVKLVTNIS